MAPLMADDPLLVLFERMAKLHALLPTELEELNDPDVQDRVMLIAAEAEKIGREVRALGAREKKHEQERRRADRAAS